VKNFDLKKYQTQGSLLKEDRFEDVEYIFKDEVDPTGKTEVEWVDSSDRHILIKRDGGGEVVGLNYMQGEEDPGFEDDDSIEPKLSEFYTENKDMVKGKTELEVIDNAIWLYFNAITQE
tara:strand:+ start:175 stop:531 length:357 start_codon:yes stop_codon:yes gene_type:complete